MILYNVAFEKSVRGVCKESAGILIPQCIQGDSGAGQETNKWIFTYLVKYLSTLFLLGARAGEFLL